MKPRIISITHNNQEGVFIPMEDRNLIKEYFPDIEDLDNDIPEWHKEILESRLEYIANNPDCFISEEEFFKELEREI